MKHSIQRWLAKGLISSECAKVLSSEEAEYTKQKIQKQFYIFLYSVGAICLGLSIFFLVLSDDLFANLVEWLYYATLSKIAVVFCITVLIYLLECRYAYKHTLLWKSNALFLASSICIGGTYIIIAQAYNIESTYALFFFFWWLSIFPIALFHGSKWVGRCSVIALLLAFSSIDSRDNLFGIGFGALLTVSATLVSVGYSVEVFCGKTHSLYTTYKNSALCIFLTTWLVMIEFFVYTKEFSEHILYSTPVRIVLGISILALCVTLWKKASVAMYALGLAIFVLLATMLFLQGYSITYTTYAPWFVYTTSSISLNISFMLWLSRVIFFLSCLGIIFMQYGKDFFQVTIAVGLLFVYGFIQYFNLDYTFYEKAFGFGLIGVVLLVLSYCIDKNIYSRIYRMYIKSKE